MKPLVSIVIPTFNRSADLRRALQSVQDQTWDRWEAVVVDNHSSDDTEDMVARINNRRIRFLKIHNKGVIGKSRNVGIADAQGEYVAFLDSDDWWMPRKLELSVAALEAGADVVYHDLYLMRPPGRRVRLRRARTWTVASPVFNDLLENGNALTNSSVVIRRPLLLDIQGYSEEADVVGWEDYDCWLRLSKHTEQFHRIDGVLGYYWLGTGNTSSPERTIRNLDRFKTLYLVPTGMAIDDRLPAWFHYVMGQACFSLGRYREAQHHIRLAVGGVLPLIKRLQTVVTIRQLFAPRQAERSRH